MSLFALGESIPDTAHAVSVSLPTWQSNIGYEEGQKWVVERMTTGYPRFFIHKSIEGFAYDIVSSHGYASQHALLFPTRGAANRCVDFVTQVQPTSSHKLEILEFVLDTSKPVTPLVKKLSPTVSAVLLPEWSYAFAKQYWQHTGDGISSRRAEFCHSLLKDGLLVRESDTKTANGISNRAVRGPKRYQRAGFDDSSMDGTMPNVQSLASTEESLESSHFLEERFGRNLDLVLLERAKSAIRRRIAGLFVHDLDLQTDVWPTVNSNSRGMQGLHESDVYLFPAGMNAIFNAHRVLLTARGQLKSVCFGFPYVDTLKILQKFGPGCEFLGHASSDDLDQLENRLRSGDRYLALFCEFPGNPLLISPDLKRIRRLADEFDFAVVVDETIGTFANINVLPAADIVVSSLTKIFSGDSNVMGGSAILNPKSKYYTILKGGMNEVYEDTYWAEDVVFMERNSRDFLHRVDRINANAEAICATLVKHASVKQIFYPKYNSSREHYDEFKLPDRGYGGLLSIVFENKTQAQTFYDSMEIAKGPSLGTNFTLCSPYVLLAHYQELAWAAQFGVQEDLVRVSVGLEDTDLLERTFMKALKATEASPNSV
ncbi:Folylpolyglutamate synthetase [Epichloe bromicola]|uniref:Folylpolyglutamate synthetase n=1 Tax=Epichloe bromicola TaxID=79588 RepID=A0ABQ0CEJ3_9HYPO